MASLGHSQASDHGAAGRVSGRAMSRIDQLLVLVVLIAIWQALSMSLGTYWIGSPWGVVTRFVAGVMSGESAAARVLHARRGGRWLPDRRDPRGRPAVSAAPAADRDRDPRPVHGRRLRRAEARARAAVHPVVRHRHRIQDRAGRDHGVLHRLLQRAGRRSARSTPSSCRWRRSPARTSATSRATSCFPARCPTSSPASASPCPIRSAAR